MNSEFDEPGKLQYPGPIALSCPRCGALGALKVGQLNFRGKLRWFESVSCDTCGLRSEADGVGLPPSKIRELLIESDGEWRVAISEIKSKANVVKVLQSALSMDMKAAFALLRTEAKTVFVGTKSESLWLAALLEAAGERPILTTV